MIENDRMEVLNLFDPFTSTWFREKIGSPTLVQEEAWPAIASNRHTLVSAPTGTGKTLSAFLVFIDRLKAQARAGELKQELQVIYISPLKSLAGDIRVNLSRPLAGIYEEERLSGQYPKGTPYDIHVGIRTGDTPQDERRRMIKKPPHILITTPESLYLMLTSISGQSILSTAKVVIIDEIHAMIDSKRGAHLMFSLARLDKLCDRQLQRIGLSATIEPLSRAAEYLCPYAKVQIVAPKMKKKVELQITSPAYKEEVVIQKPVWQGIANAVYEHCENARTVIAFVDGRAYAEKLAYYVNQIAGENFARTHHGSLSKEHRLEVEQALRDGELRLLCATSSMELGIDVGEVDRVFQIGTPTTVSSTMQRLGRAGHSPNKTSVMHIFPRTVSESLYSGMTAQVVREGGIEEAHPPRLCLDVLAQHLVSMATGKGYEIDEIMELIPKAYPFRDVTREDVMDLLAMLAGDYEHEQNKPVRPRILYDRINGRVEGDAYSRMLAVSAGGTIPDMGMFTIKTEKGVKIGELDEEFVFEARLGDKFLMGSFAWKIENIQKDAVIVSPTSNVGAKPPFYRGVPRGRALQTGLAFGKMFQRLNEACEKDTLYQELSYLGLDDLAARKTEGFIKRQISATKGLPHDKKIIIEHFRDEAGNHQMMVHSMYGKPVNTPLALLASEVARRQLRTNVSYVEDDDGFLLFPYGEAPLPEGLLYKISPDTARKILEALILMTPIFNMTFRYNGARALMMGVKKTGRLPLWVQRLRSAQMLDSIIQFKNHPLIRETKRECLEDYWDLNGVEDVLHGIQSGEIVVEEMFLDQPSPMSLPLRHQTEAMMMYDHAPMPNSVHGAVAEGLQQEGLIDPTLEQLALVSQRKRLPEDEKQLHSLLMMEGDVIAGELEIPIEWLEMLAKQNRAMYIEPGLWIAAEQEEKYDDALIQRKLEVLEQVVLRLLRYRGEHTVEQVAERYLLRIEEARNVLSNLCRLDKVMERDDWYYHIDLYEWARRETIKSRRNQVVTQPSKAYGALMINHMTILGNSSSQLEYALNRFANQVYDIGFWETVLLPNRVRGYRPELLDQYLAEGKMFWRIVPGKGVSFHPYESVDWEYDLMEKIMELEGEERILCEALYKRGASFMSSLSHLLGGTSPYDILIRLAGKGLVSADNFVPARQLMNHEKMEKVSVKQRAMVRAKAQTSGRWELCRPIKEMSAEQILDKNFDRRLILCRETMEEFPWMTALETLRIYEYTGQVRRGYFIEGLSGIQFIREEDYTSVMGILQSDENDIVWIPAIDPSQPWGNVLSHMPNRSFMQVIGTVVALQGGVPVAVFERQGKVLRIFTEDVDSRLFEIFVDAFMKKRIYPSLNRIIVKDYPEVGIELLKNAGFMKEIRDYVLYR